MRLIKNDPYVADLKNVGQLAVLHRVAKLIGEKCVSNEMFHFETSHGHIVDFRLNEIYSRRAHIADIVTLKELARLEQNPWVRYVSISHIDNALLIGLKRRL